jgi:hypothetical protein
MRGRNITRVRDPSPVSHLKMRATLSHKEGFAQRCELGFAICNGLF